MSNKDYKIYRNIMSVNPIIDKDYLGRILNLSKSQIIRSIKVTEVIESNTALVIKAIVQIHDVGGDICKKLFIKTIKRNQSENVYHSKSMQEGKFYKFIKDIAINNIPVPICYDAFVSEETGEFVIVLEDISNSYTAPNSRIISDKNIWFSCVESLARFHSAFWNHKIIDLLHSQSDEEIESDVKFQKDRLQSFLNYFKDEFDKKTKLILDTAMEINISLIREQSRRVSEKKDVTICNGDSHIYNFMLPIERGSNPLIVDFQFWGEGIGAGDLAHLTRESFSDEFKKDIQIPLVEHYHKSLLEQGVTGYSWENCLKDYRAEAATMVLIPFYQWSYFSVKHDEWIGDLQGLIYNYEYLKCDEL